MKYFKINWKKVWQEFLFGIFLSCFLSFITLPMAIIFYPSVYYIVPCVVWGLLYGTLMGILKGVILA